MASTRLENGLGVGDEKEESKESSKSFTGDTKHVGVVFTEKERV